MLPDFWNSNAFYCKVPTLGPFVLQVRATRKRPRTSNTGAMILTVLKRNHTQKNLSNWHHVHHKPHMDGPGNETGSLRAVTGSNQGTATLQPAYRLPNTQTLCYLVTGNEPCLHSTNHRVPAATEKGHSLFQEPYTNMGKNEELKRWRGRYI
jgi:hypothetical protein